MTTNVKIITSTGRELIPFKLEEFVVVQDNRNKTVTLAHYEHKQLGNRVMIFLNGTEAYLNNRGRYVIAQSDSSKCGKLIKEEAQEDVDAA